MATMPPALIRPSNCPILEVPNEILEYIASVAQKDTGVQIGEVDDEVNTLSARDLLNLGKVCTRFRAVYQPLFWKHATFKGYVLDANEEVHRRPRINYRFFMIRGWRRQQALTPDLQPFLQRLVVDNQYLGVLNPLPKDHRDLNSGRRYATASISHSQLESLRHLTILCKGYEDIALPLENYEEWGGAQSRPDRLELGTLTCLRETWSPRLLVAPALQGIEIIRPRLTNGDLAPLLSFYNFANEDFREFPPMEYFDENPAAGTTVRVREFHPVSHEEHKHSLPSRDVYKFLVKRDVKMINVILEMARRKRSEDGQA